MNISSLSPKAKSQRLTFKSKTPSPRLLFNKHYLPLKVSSPVHPRRRRSPALLPLQLLTSKVTLSSDRSPIRLYKVLDFPIERLIPHRLTPLPLPKLIEDPHSSVESLSKPPSPWKETTYDAPLSRIS